ncbi:MAG: 2-keto-4-pentenoate hydratase [Planctomycetota bacterium]
MDDDTFEHWAARQLADYDGCHPGTLFADGVTLNVEDAYRLQTAVAELRCARGERIVGYKVGCTSPAIRQQLGIDHCVTGRLYDTEQHLSEATLSRSSFDRLAIEGELAVELLRVPVADDFEGDAIPSCVSRVFPVIELHNHVLRGESPSAGELIANNAIHAGVVAGTGVVLADTDHEPVLRIFEDEQLVEECDGAELIQTIRTSLEWLLGVRGDELCAGHIVLTGSIPPLIPVRSNCSIRVETSPFGTVEAHFID